MKQRKVNSAAAAVAEAEAFIDTTVAAAKRRRSRNDEWPCTAEDLTNARDVRGLSWRAVARACGLDNPGQARKAYAELTGRSHREAGEVTQRAKRGTAGASVAEGLGWDDDTDQATIEEALRGERVVSQKGDVTWRCKTVTVLRDLYGAELTEDIDCRYPVAFSYAGGDGPLQVEFIADNGASRTVFVSKIQKIIG